MPQPLSAPFAHRELNGEMLLEALEELRLAQVPQRQLNECAQAVRELTQLIEKRGKPGMIVSDNVLGWEAAAGKGQQVSLRRLRSALIAF